jgi:hypothetical protein
MKKDINKESENIKTTIEESHNPSLEFVDTNQEEAQDELAFSTRAMRVASDDFIQNLTDASSNIQGVVDDLSKAAKEQEQIISKINTESRTLYILPNKIQEQINAIAPKIAQEVEIIYDTKSKAINNQFATLQNKLTKEFGDYQQKLTTTTNECVEQLTSAGKEFGAAMEQKLSQFANKLTHDAKAISERGNSGFVKNLLFVILFSAAISGITSYLVATQFPRYVEVKGAHDLNIYRSKINVLGAKTPDTKEEKTKTEEKVKKTK